MAQVEKEHYDFLKYVKLSRWNSYYQQIQEILNTGKKEILYIGVGDGFVPHMIKYINPGLNVTTADFDEELKPDILTNILDLSQNVSKKYDVAVCCQLLEHLEFNHFEECMEQLKSVLSNSGCLILSLPDRGGTLSMNLKIGNAITFNRYFRYFHRKEVLIDKEHYWEMNSSFQYRYDIIHQKICKYFYIVKEFEAQNNAYHHFFICEAK